MLYTVSFPIADYRTILKCDTYKIDMYNFDRFDFDQAFLRSFGKISNRHFSNYFITRDEKIYAKADNGIHFCRQTESTIGEHRVYFDCVFRRAFFGKFSARFDIGLTNRFALKSLNARELEKVINEALSLRLYSKTRKVKRDCLKDDKYVQIRDFGGVLKKEYVFATTIDPKTNYTKVKKGWLSHKLPVVVVQSSYSEIKQLKTNSNGFLKIDLPVEWNVHLYYKELRSNIPVWLIVEDENAEKNRIRALRIWLLKWHQEKQTFLSLISFINSYSKENEDSIINDLEVAECLSELLSSLQKKKIGGFTSFEVASSIMGISRQVDISAEEKFLTFIEEHQSTSFLKGRTVAAMGNNLPFKKLDLDSNSDKPIVFISHTSENDGERNWVKSLANKLDCNGFVSILDLNNLPYGARIALFMEKALKISDYVFVICTPAYKKKADDRAGGVGYETNLITEDVYEENKDRKYIPLFPKGDRKNSTPKWAAGKKGFVLENGNIDSEEFNELLRELKDEWNDNRVNIK